VGNDRNDAGAGVEADGAAMGVEDASDAPVSTGDGAVCMASTACSPPATGSQSCVSTLDAKLVDPSGAPVMDVPVYVCGTNLCTNPVKSAGDGTVHIAPCRTFVAPAFKMFADPAWGSYAARLDGAGPGFALGNVTLVPLPQMGVALDPTGGAPASSNGVTLSLSAGTTLKFDFEHQDPASQLFRAVQMTAGSLPAGLDQGVDVAWSLVPLNTTVKPAASLDVPNPKNWAAGAAVDFLLNGSDASTAKPPAPWGTWGALGTGAVSADGQSIHLSAASGGLPEIGMVGVKLH
jgi:hypothetical protein